MRSGRIQQLEGPTVAVCWNIKPIRTGQAIPVDIVSRQRSNITMSVVLLQKVATAGIKYKCPELKLTGIQGTHDSIVAGALKTWFTIHVPLMCV